MAKKKDLGLLIQRIKAATGLKQADIAASIKYSRPYFSTLKGANSVELYDLLEAHFKDVLESKNLLEESGMNYNSKKDTNLNQERAMLQVIMAEVAKIKSKLYGMSVESASDELMQNTRLALKQMNSEGE